ncbi:MAG: DUF2231 domain-containing protein [Nocardioides sp.]
MEISGLPLHPLVVHAAVIFGPIGALTAVAYAALRGWRDRLRMPMVALALLATGSVVAAYLTGRNFLESRPELSQKPMMATHEARAELLLWLTLGFGAVALAAGWMHTRAGAARVAIRVLLGLAAAAVLVSVVLTGDAGTRAVWESL